VYFCYYIEANTETYTFMSPDSVFFLKKREKL